MTTTEKILLTCAIALSGFGISLIGTSTAARNSPPTLFFTSVTLYLSEAVLFWAFFAGLWWLTRSIVGRRFWARNPHEVQLLLPNVSETALRRFAGFQIVLVAVWSLCFKGVLYTTLNPAYSHYLMAKSQSLGIAIPAELLILVLALAGLYKWWLKGKPQHHRTAGDVLAEHLS